MRHRLDGKRYAIKIIQLKKDQPALNKEIENEAVTLANLQHHRIVQYKFVRKISHCNSMTSRLGIRWEYLYLF